MAIEEAIRAYHQIIADPEFRKMERLREKARQDEEAALRHARDEERLRIARKMKEMGYSDDQIQTITSLPAESI
jgi:type VI protein secretion system component VasF